MNKFKIAPQEMLDNLDTNICQSVKYDEFQINNMSRIFYLLNRIDRKINNIDNDDIVKHNFDIYKEIRNKLFHKNSDNTLFGNFNEHHRKRVFKTYSTVKNIYKRDWHELFNCKFPYVWDGYRKIKVTSEKIKYIKEYLRYQNEYDEEFDKIKKSIDAQKICNNEKYQQYERKIKEKRENDIEAFSVNLDDIILEKEIEQLMKGDAEHNNLNKEHALLMHVYNNDEISL